MTTAASSAGTLEQVLARIARRWSRWNGSVRDHPVRPTLSEQELNTRMATYDFEQPRALEETVEDMADLLERGSLHAAHPRYFGLFVPGVREAGVAGDALAALAARFPGHPEDGLRDARPVFYASDQAHDSFVKIARTAGLGARAVRRVRTTAAQRLDVEALERMIAADRAQGESPFLVVATVGSTATGAIDPLTEIADLCRREDLWMHADAAWGGIALLSARLRQTVSGLERADSVTWDAHKTLPVPMGAGMFFVRDRRHTDAVFSVRTAYVPEADPGTLDAYQHTIQWSRRFIGLKVFLTLAELGREGIERIVDRQAAMAALLRQELRASGWTITNDTLLPVVCFGDDRASCSQTSALARYVAEEGRAWISEVRLPDERWWLRACITPADVGPPDVRALVDALDRARVRSNQKARMTGARTPEGV